MRFLFPVLLILQTFAAWSQDFKLPNGQKVTQEQIRILTEKLPRLQEDKIFYHWTKPETGIRWVTQSALNAGEVQFLNIPTAGQQVYGSGIYLADNPASSRNFGDLPVAFKIQKGTILYDESIVRKVLGNSLAKQDLSVLGQHIPFVRKVSDEHGWFVTNHVQNTGSLSYGKLHSAEASLYVKTPEAWSILGDTRFKEVIQNGDQDALYLKRVLALSDYMDGVGFARAMKVNPANPWNEFVPEKFDQYQKALAELPQQTKKYFELGDDIIRNGLIDEMLPKIYSAISGEPISKIETLVRSEGVRAGGSDPGNSFLATQEHYDELKKNPYLQVVATEQGNGKYLVHYFYPDAFHYQHLKGKISDELFLKLQNINPDHLMGNHALRNELNKRLITELLRDLEANFSEKPIKQILKDLISIHPFNDFNGRTMRMISKLYAEQRGVPNRHFFMSDMDLLVSDEAENALLKRSRLAHLELQREFIDEFLLAKSEKRMPDYLKTGALERYVRASQPADIYIDINDKRHQEMIKNRQWTQLIESSQHKFWADISNKILNVSTREEGIAAYRAVRNLKKMNELAPEVQEIILKTLNDKITPDAVVKNIGIIKEYFRLRAEVMDPAVLLKISPEAEVLNKFSEAIKSIDVKSIQMGIMLENARTLHLNYETKLAFIYQSFVKNIFDDTDTFLRAEKIMFDLNEIIRSNPKAVSQLSLAKQEELLKVIREISDDYIDRGKDSSKFLNLYTKLLPHIDPAVAAKVPNINEMKIDLTKKLQRPANNCVSDVLKAFIKQHQ